ncbi:diguanylate cyclase [Sulfurospirillum sp. 1307]
MQKNITFWNRFVKFITFINLPIKKKFLLFGMGTFFWFFTIVTCSIFALTFVNYKYSQITNTTIPYFKAIQVISMKIDNIEEFTKWAFNDENQEKYMLKIIFELNQIKSAISDITINATQNQNYNAIESLTYTLSKEDLIGEQKLQAIVSKINNMDELLSKKGKNIFEPLRKEIKETKNILEEFSKRTNSQLNNYTQQINKIIKYAINTIGLVFLIATFLLWFFTRWLTRAFSKPIEAMTHQIHSIGTGEVDLNKKLTIKSEDEIGVLSREFNKLVDTVYGVTVFKKVIEEDSSLDAVYTRLAEVFEKEAKIKDFKIFDVNVAKEQMGIVHPPLSTESSMDCHSEILHDCSLCRAQKTGHKISSLEYEGVCRQFTNTENKEHICIPLMVAGKPRVVVQFVFDKKNSDEDVERINEKIFKAESYIKNSLSVIETKLLMQTLRETSLVDGLTGLYNRRFLQDHSNQIIAGVLRRKKQIGLIMCDMDFFKQVNDEHGHDIGDAVLKETSRVLRESVRESDVVIRFGGEEFLILLIDSEEGFAIKTAEKIRENISKTKFQSSKAGALKKTISIGVSEFPKDTNAFWQAIKFADVALYSAKETGRNKCVRFTKEMWKDSEKF